MLFNRVLRLIAKNNFCVEKDKCIALFISKIYKKIKKHISPIYLFHVAKFEGNFSEKSFRRNVFHSTREIISYYILLYRPDHIKTYIKSEKKNENILQ